jgi:hypothetical protein
LLRIETQQIIDPIVTIVAPYQKFVDRLECKTITENAEESIGEK